MFNPQECTFPTVYCGERAVPQGRQRNGDVYTRRGTGYECMKKGFGAGSATEKSKSLPRDSLQKIRFIGDRYSERFREIYHINTISDLRRVPAANLDQILRRVCTNSSGAFDARSYNSVLLYLYDNALVPSARLPRCTR